MKKTQIKSQQNLDKLRHSCAHLLGAAVLELYPNALLAIGPSIEDGFYYDIDFGEDKIADSDLEKIENKMRQLAPTWEKFERKEISEEEALKLYSKNVYKQELIKEFAQKKDKITIYSSGNFTDLCRGGHVENPSQTLKYFKLTSIAGAYWRGNEKNPMLTRIYGTAFYSQEELDTYLKLKEEAKKRDHRKIAQELDLIVFSDLVGSGLPLYTPKGAILRSLVYNYSRQLNQKIGYGETSLPGFNRAELFKISGHYEKYKDDMFRVISNYSKDEFFLKPMNCPQHCALYASRSHSYKELPVRFSDFSILYRDEKPGELNGLLRSRAFTQDDGHAFVREDQIQQEFENVLKAIKEALNTYGFEFWMRLSLRDPKNKQKYLGNDQVWEKAENALKNLAQKHKLDALEAPGEAAIYGPKLDFMVKDSLGREWQLSTIQLDMIMPKRFNLYYIDEKGNKKTPYMIHRAIVGSERFIGILIEHFAGSFPVWLSPIQAKILPISQKQHEYAKELLEKLIEIGIRAEIDDRSESLNAKIRDAQLQKIPYMLIIGEKEEKLGQITIRMRDGNNIGQTEISGFIDKILEKIQTKSLSLSL
ncbi:MAG: threonine--tRNA ligase [Patescibacteria group bacterium]|nr:threonine--tRNA ligase [Patescibacteria group bacterium]